MDMINYKVVRRFMLRQGNHATGRTVHTVAGRLAPTPVELQIAQYDGDTGYYLFYCDESGHPITDTYHESIDGALSQAEWEFNTTVADWETVQ
jgi:hypothetical protein